VVIIGGGLAGMAAAESLASHSGHRTKITILEARRVTGGRAGSFADPVREETVDYCQHVAMGCCTNLLQLLQRAGLDTHLRRHESLTFAHPLTNPCKFAPSSLFPAPFHLAGAIGSMSFLDQRQRWQVRRGMARLLRTAEEDLRGQFAGQWLRRHGQADDTIEEFWGTFAVSALGEEVDRVDMSAVRKVMVDGFAAARGASDVLVPTLPLSDLFGDRLPKQIEQLGVSIRTGQAVTGVAYRGDSAVVQTSSGETIHADHVISTLPWFSLDKLIADVPQLSAIRRSAEIPSSSITGVHLWLDREITKLPLVVLVGTVAQWLFRPPWRDGRTERGEHYYQVVISASNMWRSLSKEALVQRVMSDIRHLSEAACDAQLLHSRVVTDPHSVFSIRPDVLELRPPASTSLPWFHLAGDWIDTGWPATMEGAVISGRMAASSVAYQEGWEPIEIDPGLPRGPLARFLIR
jgi:squalene-associated FAD-dependent desaturase